MTNTEVHRLRRLRQTALKVRELSKGLEPRPRQIGSVWSRSGAACWSIARVVTGQLRSHPYIRYQQESGAFRLACDEIAARVIGGVARCRGRSLPALSLALQRVAHELTDARALTWSAELSDAFGRAQAQVGSLVQEIGPWAGGEEVYDETVSRRDPKPQADDNWPYLAI